MSETIDKVISNFLEGIISDKRIREEISSTMIRGAENSGETEEFGRNITTWFNTRFKPNCVVLDRTDYSKALIRSLWIAPNLAALDFVGGRLRDFAQLWTDTARGFLGEIAIQKFLKNSHNLDIYLETRRGEAKEFMPSDVLVIEKGTDKPRASKTRVSIKTTKFNGRWLEIPESQFRQSDVFVCVKLGISRYHFTSYLKETVKQLLREGLSIKELNEEQVQTLTNEIPEWNSIPAYVSGFVDKEKLHLPIDNLHFRTPRKRTKNANGVRPISRIEIEGGIGLFSDSTIHELPEIKKLGVPPDIQVDIAGIEKEVDGNFYASTGLLTFRTESWKEIIQRI
jgi:hypothetical protein